MDSVNDVTGLTSAPAVPPPGPSTIPGETAPVPLWSAPALIPLSRLSLRTSILYSVANIGLSMVTAFFTLGLPKYLDGYHVRPEIIGLLASEQPIRGSIIAPFVGRLSDRTRTRLGRRRPYFLIGPPLTALTLLALGLHPPLGLMIALVALSGLWAVANDPYLALMADITPPEQRGLVGGLLGFADLTGGIIFLVVSGFLWVTHQFAVFLVVAVGLLLTFGVTFATVKEPAQPRPVRRGALNPLRYWREIWENRELAKFFGVSILGGLAKGGATPFLILLLTKALRVPVGQAFFLTLPMTAITLLTVLPVGWLGSRFGKQPVLVVGTLLGSVGLAALAVMAATGVHATLWIIIVLMVIGFSASAGAALILPFCMEFVPAGRMGELVGVWSLIGSSSIVIGAVSAGHLVNSQQPASYGHPFIWSAALYACTALGLLTLRPARARADNAGLSELASSAAGQ